MTYICTICKYKHKGDNPPENCPECFATKDKFVLEEENEAPPKRYKCIVCGYIHIGPEPPEICPVCKQGKDKFILLEEDNLLMQATDLKGAVENANESSKKAAIEKMSYGLYIITSIKENGSKMNGQCANTVFQLTSNPPQLAICINKNNLTHEYLNESKTFAISILGKNNIDMAKHFGYNSGKNIDKFKDIQYTLGKNSCPILKDSVAFLECTIEDKSVDVGTHTLFIANIDRGSLTVDKSDAESLTYKYYLENK
ncbi:flavin reductase [Selenomonadales bacterium OttesenSCG-928-I06]|nr:flavin reductase [Selenomonadales bacterium OttesenSCG-928-I06]